MLGMVCRLRDIHERVIISDHNQSVIGFVLRGWDGTARDGDDGVQAYPRCRSTSVVYLLYSTPPAHRPILTRCIACMHTFTTSEQSSSVRDTEGVAQT